jgi:hypothetical protein
MSEEKIVQFRFEDIAHSRLFNREWLAGKGLSQPGHP